MFLHNVMCCCDSNQKLLTVYVDIEWYLTHCIMWHFGKSFDSIQSLQRLLVLISNLCSDTESVTSFGNLWDQPGRYTCSHTFSVLAQTGRGKMMERSQQRASISSLTIRPRGANGDRSATFWDPGWKGEASEFRIFLFQILNPGILEVVGWLPALYPFAMRTSKSHVVILRATAAANRCLYLALGIMIFINWSIWCCQQLYERVKGSCVQGTPPSCFN